MKNQKLEDVYFYLLERTVRQFRKYAQEKMKEIGVNLTGDQWVILKRISEEEGINQRELANSTYKDPASVTRILDILEKQNYVERRGVEGNRRAYAMYLKTKGKETVEKMLPVAVETRAHGLTGVSDEDFKTFKTTLNQIYENFQ